jgi:hypothetical protein
MTVIQAVHPPILTLEQERQGVTDGDIRLDKNQGSFYVFLVNFKIPWILPVNSIEPDVCGMLTASPAHTIRENT